MSLPETCPFCSEPKFKTDEDGDIDYRCGSWSSMRRGSFRSHRCKDAELARLAARVAALEAENKDLRNRAELADGDVKRAQAILDASNTYIRRIEVDLQRESQAKIDAEFHVAALKERVAEMENVKREMGGAR